MKSVLIDKYAIFLIGCLLSLTTHIITFTVFTLKIPLIKESYKPSVTFLGSILGNHDTFLTKANNKSELTNSQQILISAPQESKIEGPAKAVFTDASIKHLIQNPSSYSAKSDIKSTFLKQDLEETNANPAINIKINLDSTPYEPLKLKNHD